MRHLCIGSQASSIFASTARPAKASRWPSATVSLASNIFLIALCHSAAILFAMALPASNSATAPRPATSPQRPSQQQLCHGVPASNKPHPAEKSTPVWLAIWRTWAGFANSQHRNAAFATPDNICAHSSLLPHWAAAQTDANLSAHLHRLPTPPPYLRRMRLSLGLVRRYWMQDEAVA